MRVDQSKLQQLSQYVTEARQKRLEFSGAVNRISRLLGVDESNALMIVELPAWQSSAAKGDLSFKEQELVAVFDGQPGEALSLAYIKERLGVSNAAASTRIGKLMDRGLVVRLRKGYFAYKGPKQSTLGSESPPPIVEFPKKYKDYPEPVKKIWFFLQAHPDSRPQTMMKELKISRTMIHKYLNRMYKDKMIATTQRGVYCLK